MPITGKEMVRKLKQHGFEEVSQNGSHLKMKNFSNGRMTIVPMHGKVLSKGIEQAILKQAGIKD